MKTLFITCCLFFSMSLFANAQYASSNTISNGGQNVPGTLSARFGGQLYCNGVLVNPEVAQSFMTAEQFEAYLACEKQAKAIKNNLMTALYIEGGTLAVVLVGSLTRQPAILYASVVGQAVAAGFLIYALVQAGSNTGKMENLISDITFGTNHSASLSLGATTSGIGLALRF